MRRCSALRYACLRMTDRHYHFAIPQSNIFDYVVASSFTEAKYRAFEEYGPWYNLIEWLDKDTPNCSSDDHL